MNNGLKVVRPVALTDAMIVSTTVPEADYPAWGAGTTYALGDRVIVTATHKVYESAQAGNTGKAPASNAAWWLEVGPTNRWAAFDRSNSTQTAQATSMVYVIAPGQAIDTLSVLSLTNAAAIRVQMNDVLYGALYDKTVNLLGLPAMPDWWSWFFGARAAPKQIQFLGLPLFPTAELTITITGGPALAVGVILFGQRREFSLGVQRGARLGIQDYSRKERNDFGDTVLVQRAFSRRSSFDMFLMRNEVDALIDFLADVRAEPCLWIVSEREEALTIYGFYKSFEVLINYHDYADCSLEIEGMT